VRDRLVLNTETGGEYDASAHKPADFRHAFYEVVLDARIQSHPVESATLFGSQAIVLFWRGNGTCSVRDARVALRIEYRGRHGWALFFVRVNQRWRGGVSIEQSASVL
jgi:hypothetical protein